MAEPIENTVEGSLQAVEKLYHSLVSIISMFLERKPKLLMCNGQTAIRMGGE